MENALFLGGKCFQVEKETKTENCSNWKINWKSLLNFSFKWKINSGNTRKNNVKRNCNRIFKNSENMNVKMNRGTMASWDAISSQV